MPAMGMQHHAMAAQAASMTPETIATHSWAPLAQQDPIGISIQQELSPYGHLARPQLQSGRSRSSGWHFDDRNCPEHRSSTFGYRVPLQGDYTHDWNFLLATMHFYVPYKDIRSDLTDFEIDRYWYFAHEHFR
eukprot:IDg12294t1